MALTLLTLFAQADPTATPIQQAAAAGMSGYEFVLALLDKQAVLIIAGGLGAVLASTALLIRYYANRLLAGQAAAAAAATRAGVVAAAAHDELKEVRSEIDGKMTRLLETTERAAKAEAKAEVLEQVAAAPAVPPVVVYDPDAQPGGRRKFDKAITPPGSSAPVDQSPETHQP